MGAIGAWIGLEQGVKVLFCVALAGIILAIFKALMHRRLKVVLTNIYTSVYIFICHLSSHNTRQYIMSPEGTAGSEDLTVPYGVAIFVGVCAAGCMILL